jgi:hypothetical protein
VLESGGGVESPVGESLAVPSVVASFGFDASVPPSLLVLSPPQA